MNIIQFMPTIAFGDAVSNDAIAILDLLIDMKFDSYIYAENIDSRIKNKRIKRINKKVVNYNNIILYHFSTGTPLNKDVFNYSNRVIGIYHNITPPEYFGKYNKNMEKLCQNGYNELKDTINRFDEWIADSQYNKSELIRMGCTKNIQVIPILIKFEDYSKSYSIDAYNRFNDGKKNILFTGRIAPNKKHEDLIRIVYEYKRFISNDIRLILVGSELGNEQYYQRLKRYINILGVNDEVVFLGHVTFETILAAYRVADVFLCVSDHEGFCVPLVEAMQFSIPVIAKDTTAIKYTMGESGIIVNSDNPIEYALLIDKVLNNDKLRQDIVDSQSEELERYSNVIVKNSLRQYIDEYIDKVRKD